MIYQHSNQHDNFQISEPVKLYEIDLVEQWAAIKPGSQLLTTNGQSIIIINKGILNKHEGPDFKNASVVINGKLKTGDVECHVNANDWFKHNHHLDERFAQVILHVVREINLNNCNPSIPTIEFKSYKKIPNHCNIDRFSVQQNILDIIIHFSELRWQRKVNGYFNLYENNVHLKNKLISDSFAILGAGGNKNQFIKIASNIDLKQLTRCSTEVIKEYLLELSNKLNIDWLKKGIRPAQQPHNRMMLAAELIKYFDLYDNNLRFEFSKIRNNFINICPSSKGKGIQAEIFGNVIVPYLASEALYNKNYNFYTKYLEIWHRIKLPATYQKYLRRFEGIISQSALKQFSILQGLIEIDHKWCNNNLCDLCPLKKHYGNS